MHGFFLRFQESNHGLLHFIEFSLSFEIAPGRSPQVSGQVKIALFVVQDQLQDAGKVTDVFPLGLGGVGENLHDGVVGGLELTIKEIADQNIVLKDQAPGRVQLVEILRKPSRETGNERKEDLRQLIIDGKDQLLVVGPLLEIEAVLRRQVLHGGEAIEQVADFYVLGAGEDEPGKVIAGKSHI